MEGSLCASSMSQMSVGHRCQSPGQPRGRHAVMGVRCLWSQAASPLPKSPGFPFGSCLTVGVAGMLQTFSSLPIGPQVFFKSRWEKGKSNWNFSLPGLGIPSLSLESRRNRQDVLITAPVPGQTARSLLPPAPRSSKPFSSLPCCELPLTLQ